MAYSDLKYPHPAELLPGKASFLMIDRIEDYIAGESLTAIKNLDDHSYFTEDSIKNQPLMPEVFLIEAMFQACRIFGRLEEESANTFIGKEPKKFGRAAKINHITFYKDVRMGATLKISLKLELVMLNFVNYDIKLCTENGVVAKGTITISLNN